jgi:Fe-S cluster assembly protein SufD
MITMQESKDVYRSSFAAFQERLAEDARSPLQRLRRTAFERFAALGFPTLKDEEWRFTNLAPLLKVPFEPGDNGQRPHFGPQNTSLPDGVVVSSLAEALIRYPELVEPHLARYADYAEHPFTALNTAFLLDGAFVYVPGGKVVEEPIELAFTTEAAGTLPVWHRRCLIVAGPHSQARIVERYDASDGVSFTNAVTEVVAAEDSVLDYYRVQNESRQAFHIATVQVHQERGSTFTSHVVARGGRIARTDLNVVLDGEACTCTLNGLSLATGEQLIDNHTRIDHAQPRCTSHELYKAILDGRAHGVFNGKIYVHLDAQKTDARQTNQTLLLSDEAVMDTKPQLEIFADDVKCTHGASIGQLDEEQLFYLRTRGIDRTAARRLLTYGFANDIIGRVQIESLRAQLEASVMGGKEVP